MCLFATRLTASVLTRLTVSVFLSTTRLTASATTRLNDNVLTRITVSVNLAARDGKRKTNSFASREYISTNMLKLSYTIQLTTLNDSNPSSSFSLDFVQVRSLAVPRSPMILARFLIAQLVERSVAVARFRTSSITRITTSTSPTIIFKRS